MKCSPRIFGVLLGTGASISLATSALAYYGRHSQEAILTYRAPIEVPTGLSNERIHERIAAQIQHLMGTFQSASFLDEFAYPGVLGEDYEVTLGEARRGRTAGTLTYSYTYRGKVVFEKSAFRGTAPRSVPLKLPLDPQGIYALGWVGEENKCTDHHYNSEGDFWYFWDPDQAHCPLYGNESDVVRISGKLKPLANTKLTYPEYDRLYAKARDTTEISVFLGYIDDIKRIDRPSYKDVGYESYQFIQAELVAQRFKLVEEKKGFREYPDGSQRKGGNFYQVYEKRVTALDRERTLRVNLLLSDTSITSSNSTFHQYLVRGFENSDIVVYDGHSGLGGNLDLSALPAIGFPAKKYQLFFFNGCSSYPYFNGMFFQAKGGSKYLDVVTSGLPTMSDVTGPNVMTFIRPFIAGKTWSYQKILAELEKSNGWHGTSLMGVNGDEDNRYLPDYARGAE